MDPISISVELELATLLLTGVGAIATWLHHKHAARSHRQRERQHRELMAMHERHRTERLGPPETASAEADE